MSQHKSHGRRRASASVPHSEPAAHRGRRYRTAGAKRSRTSAPDVGGFSQKAAIVVATSGLAMTVIMPATAADTPSQHDDPARLASAVPAETVTAASSAAVTFDRGDLRSGFDPEAKLHKVMVSSNGALEPAAADGTLAAPIENAEETSGFGYRVNPLTGWAGELHTGQDFGVSCGAAVLAAADGVVVEAGWHAGGGGNRIVVDHGDGLETTYNHLSSIDVRVGQSVSRGHMVGASGTTGSSTGCHLHFEVLVNGQTVDPQGWL